MDGVGRTFADTHRKNLVPKIVEDGKDPLDNDELCAQYLKNHRYPSHSDKDTRLQERFCYHLTLADLHKLRGERPLFDTLVTIHFLLNTNSPYCKQKTFRTSLEECTCQVKKSDLESIIFLSCNNIINFTTLEYYISNF